MSFFTIRLESLFIVLGIAKKASWGNRWGSILELISSNHALELIKGRVYLHAFDCLFITINPWHIHLAPSPVSRYNKAWRAVCTGVSSLALLVYLLVFIIHILPGQILPLTHPWFVWLSYLRWDVLRVLHVPSPRLSCTYLVLSLMLSLSFGLTGVRLTIPVESGVGILPVLCWCPWHPAAATWEITVHWWVYTLVLIWDFLHFGDMENLSWSS